MKIQRTERQGKVLDFDIENRPLSYRGMEFTTAEITAIAWAFGDAYPTVALLTKVARTYKSMIVAFLEAYDEADLLTGHNIRRHDLPLINAACLELGLRPLAPKLTSDTWADLTKRKDLSTSQEALAAMYGLPEPKHHMSQAEWRESNRLTPAGIENTRARCYEDVVQHRALRTRLIEAGALKPPKRWSP